MKHAFSVLVCVMDDGTKDIFVNGVHCYRGLRELTSPEKLVDKRERKEVSAVLMAAQETIDMNIEVQEKLNENPIQKTE